MATPINRRPDSLNQYFAFRDQMLGEYRALPATTEQLCMAGELMHGNASKFALYGIPAPKLKTMDLTILGRTVIECSVDEHSDAVALRLRDEIDRGDHPDSEQGIVVDLFCGSGNIGYRLGYHLHRPVFASDSDPLVYQATQHNIVELRKWSNVQFNLTLTDYRILLTTLPNPSTSDIFTIEPPWGPAFNANGLDLTKTSPPVAEIVADIRRSRAGTPCYVVIKTNDQIANGSLQVSMTGAKHLASVTPPPTLPYGGNIDFHIYRLP